MDHPLYKKLEELMTIQCQKLSDNIKVAIARKSKAHYLYHKNKPSTKAGVYQFWWTGDKSLLTEASGFLEQQGKIRCTECS